MAEPWEFDTQLESQTVIPTMSEETSDHDSASSALGVVDACWASPYTPTIVEETDDESATRGGVVAVPDDAALADSSPDIIVEYVAEDVSSSLRVAGNAALVCSSIPTHDMFHLLSLWRSRRFGGGGSPMDQLVETIM